VAIIDFNRRSGGQRREFSPCEAERFKECTTVVKHARAEGRDASRLTARKPESD
jgi:hypothetical protein